MEKKLEIGRRVRIYKSFQFGYGTVLDIDNDSDILVVMDNSYGHSAGATKGEIYSEYKDRCWYFLPENVTPCRRVVDVYNENGEVINNENNK